MKKSIFWAVFISLSLAFSSAAFAQNDEEKDPLGGLGGVLKDILAPEQPEAPPQEEEETEVQPSVITQQAPVLGVCASQGDCDGDGARSFASGGGDCDDNDASRFPGNLEISDPYNVDEDCDPMTVGSKDIDEDGYVDALSCNIDQTGMLVCGTDCDDNNAAIVPGAQMCASATAVRICNGTGQTTQRAQGESPWRIAQCSSVGENRCAGQPNRTGICTK